MHLWQGHHRRDFVLFPLRPFRWHPVLKCSITDDVHIDHLIKVMSASHLHCEVFGRWWGTLRNFVPDQNFNFYIDLLYQYGFPQWLNGKEFACQYRRHGFDPWVRKIPWRRKWQPTPVFLPEKSHGQRSLEGYSPRCRRVRHDLVSKQQQLTHTPSKSTYARKPRNSGQTTLILQMVPILQTFLLTLHLNGSAGLL